VYVMVSLESICNCKSHNPQPALNWSDLNKQSNVNDHPSVISKKRTNSYIAGPIRFWDSFVNTAYKSLYCAAPKARTLLVVVSHDTRLMHAYAIWLHCWSENESADGNHVHQKRMEAGWFNFGCFMLHWSVV
jgi:hypothetical protein